MVEKEEDTKVEKEEEEVKVVVVVCRPPVFRVFPYAISIAGSRPSSPNLLVRPGLRPSGFPHGGGYPHEVTVERMVAAQVVHTGS